MPYWYLIPVSIKTLTFSILIFIAVFRLNHDWLFEIAEEFPCLTSVHGHISHVPRAKLIPMQW